MSYQPYFELKQVGDFFWILDQGKPFLLYCKSLCQLDQFRFRPEDESIVSGPMEIENYHLPTILGARTALFWGKSGERTPRNMKETWDVKPDRIYLELRDETPTLSLHRVTITFDAVTGEYLCSCHATFKRNTQYSIEAYNIYMTGLENDHPGFKRDARCEYTVWRGLDGRIRKCRNSHPFSYLSVPTGRGKYLAPPGKDSFIGFGSGPKLNPIWNITYASPRIGSVTTCDMFFDQHLIIDAPGLENRDENGHFVLEMKTEVRNLSANAMKSNIEGALEVSYREAPGQSRNGVKIRLEDTSTLNRLVDREDNSIDSMAIFPSWYAKARALDFKECPSGGSFLCLNAEVKGEASFHYWEPRPTFPPQRKVMLRVRGEAKGLDRPAFVGLCTTQYNFDDIKDIRYSEPIIENGTWERRVEIDNGIYHFVMPLFMRLGNGDLWIKEIDIHSVEFAASEPVPSNAAIMEKQVPVSVVP